MVARLTIIFFIALCFLTGFFLVLLPWQNLGAIGDWGDNYLLSLFAQKTGMPFLQQAIASGWVRGAITGLGILNLFVAFWEIAHFRRGVETLEQENKRLSSGKS